MEHGQGVLPLLLMYQLLMRIIDRLQECNIKPCLKTENTVTHNVHHNYHIFILA